MKKKQGYIDKEILEKQILDSYQKDTITEELGRSILLMLNHILSMKCWHWKDYPIWHYDECYSKALEDSIKALQFKKYDPEKNSFGFSYLTRVMLNGILVKRKKYLKIHSKESKYMELLREQLREQYGDQESTEDFDQETT